ncbi:MAG: ATP-binding cassette domain-containing protein [Mollicutes bacterium]|nr:ATP-binding cassette domain-containing protein [Mollicutes bacterium]
MLGKGLEIHNLNKKYKSNKTQKLIFNNLNIEFESNKIHCILGKSGCGKSTLLRIIAGIEKYDDGNIIFNDTKGEKLFISMVLQDNNLLPWLTVYNNIKFVLKSVNKNIKNYNQTIMDFLKKVDLTEYKDYYPYQLSVGMKQRISLLKALINNPNYVLLDEPFSALDYITREEMHDLFLKEYNNKKFTSIISTHSIDEAIKLSDYIHIIGKDGKYKKIKNTLKKPRDKDSDYITFFEYIKSEYM